jgi:flagellar hook-basal body complex protein FliE
MDPLRPISGDIPPIGDRAVAPPPTHGGSFESALGKALSSVEELQENADREAEKVALGGGNLHEAALALEKADIAMHLAVKIRNKFIDAYQEVMRMSV